MLKSIKSIGKAALKLALGDVRWIEYQLRSGRIHKNGYYDRLTDIVMKRALRSDSVCVDVGCHEGSILRLMMQFAPRGRFLAFEPLPHLYQQLLLDFPDPNVRCFNLALSNAEGETSFNYVVTNPGYSGMLKRRYDRPHEEDTPLRVQTRMLDNILTEENVGPVNFIKIDVEGAECLVMEGARRCIARDKPVIVFEHGLGGSDCYGKGPDDVFELLCRECGMQISLLPNWLLGKPPMTLAEFQDQFHQGKNYYFIAHA